MNMQEAVTVVEQFLDGFKSAQWNPASIWVTASAEELKTVKVQLGFPPDTDGSLLKRLRAAPLEALRKAHPELGEFRIEIRGEILSGVLKAY